MIRINDPKQYLWMDEKERLELRKQKNRRIRLKVNTLEPTCLYMVETLKNGKDSQPHYLCKVDGLETVEFTAAGTVFIEADKGMYVHAAEIETVHHVVDDPEIFTKVMQRRKRNPELERMQWEMRRNMETRLALQAEENERMLKSIRAEVAASAKKSGDTGDVSKKEQVGKDDDSSESASSDASEGKAGTKASEGQGDDKSTESDGATGKST